MPSIVPPPADDQLPDRRAYIQFLARLLDIHDTGPDFRCVHCDVPVPCDTMRAAWIFDLETHRVGA